MSAEVKRVKALREAFVSGATWAIHTQEVTSCENAQRQSFTQYPMPTVEVPRVVEDEIVPGRRVYWRVFHGQLQWRTDDPGEQRWMCIETVVSMTRLNRARITLLADLYANPTITCTVFTQYPMPTVEVPRVVEDEIVPGRRVYWRVFHGQLQWRTDDPGEQRWMCIETVVSMTRLNRARITLLADLYANPTITCTVDEVSP